MCVEALLVVWSDLSEVYLWKSLWVTLIAIGFVLVFKAQLSGAKFNVVAELRAPTTDLCDLGLSVDPETVFVSLYFAQVLRESCLCFRYGRRICKRRCGSGTDRAWREGKKSHSYAYDSGTATACTRTSTFQDELAGGRTRFALEGQLHLTPLYHLRRRKLPVVNWTARSVLHCADDSDSPDSIFEFESGYG